jgi:proline-specific peptidase
LSISSRRARFLFRRALDGRLGLVAGLALGAAALAHQVVVENEFIAVGHQQVGGRLLDADADHLLGVLAQLGHQRRKVGIAGDDDEGVDVGLGVAQVQRIDDHADVGRVLAGLAHVGDFDQLEVGLVHRRLEALVAVPVAIRLLDHDAALQQQTLQHRLDVELVVVGVAHTERHVFEIAEQRHADVIVGSHERKALGLDNKNFYLLGHSWGGILAIEYALKYQQNLKGLIISNMMASIPAYNDYASKVLMPKMDQKALAEIKQLEAEKKYTDPRYMDLLLANHYVYHVLRMPPDQWPEPVNRSFSRMNQKVYVPMQGPSELGASGILENWDRVKDLKKITVPTLVIGAEHDTMDPAHMKMMSQQVKQGTYLYCPKGSHMAMYDDQQAYFKGLIAFLQKTDKKAAK